MIVTISCALLLWGCGAKDDGTISMEQYPDVVRQSEELSDEQEDEAEVAGQPQADEKLYVIISIDTEQRTIVLGLTDSPRTLSYGYTRATQILDDHGQFMSAERLSPGRVVTIGALDDEAKLATIQLAERAWYQENITRFSIDPTIGMLVIGDTKYRYDEYLRVFSQDQEISLEQVGTNDVICVQGVDKQIVSVQVTTGHGTIALVNTELFEGGWISLGTKIYAKITPDLTMEVPEGKYELSVANDGYGDSKTVEVEREQVTTVDLDEYRGEGPKLCQVTFEIYVQDAKLYIDGDPVDYEDPVELRYGVHQLTVIADGFETWERQLVIHSGEATIQIGEPELAEGDDDSQAGGDSQENQVSADNTQDTQENQSSADDTQDTQAQETETGSYISDTAETGASDSGSGTGTGEETGSDATDSQSSSTENYSDYLETISDLVKSLTNLEN